jgi:hypothetical protein
MALPSTNLSLDDIYQESTPGYGSSLLSFGDVSYPSWPEGNLGSQTYIFNPYGMDGTGSGAPLGADVIYNFPILDRSVPDPVSFAEYLNNQYYFDGTTFDIKFSYNNTLTNPPPVPPNPPIINDVNVQVDCYDYNGVYTVHNSFAINANASTSQSAITIPGFNANTSPLVENVYWSIIVTTDPNNTISNIAFSVNGTTRINVGSGGGSFTWQSGGASQGFTNSAGIVYDITVT